MKLVLFHSVGFYLTEILYLCFIFAAILHCPPHKFCSSNLWYCKNQIVFNNEILLHYMCVQLRVQLAVGNKRLGGGKEHN